MTIKLPVFLDYHSTTPVDPRVFEVMKPFFTEDFGNPASRTHQYGIKAKSSVDLARNQIARVLNADSEKDIVFVSGATEANNLALAGLSSYLLNKDKGHLISSKIEHKSVLDVVHHMEKHGFEVTWLKIPPDGVIKLKDVETAIKKNTGLVSIMQANNEIGTINPIEEIGRLLSGTGIIFHSDAAQSFGKIPVDVKKLGVHLLSISGHKIYGPKGIGALYVDRKVMANVLQPIIHGGGHEQGMRSGTLATPLIVGFGAAAELAMKEMKQDSQGIGKLRDRLLEGLRKEIKDMVVNGSMKDRLPNNLNVSFPGVDSEALMLTLRDELALSSGSACTSSTWASSYVLNEIGVEESVAKGTIRFGLGRFNTEEDVNYVIKAMVLAIINLKRMSLIT